MDAELVRWLLTGLMGIIVWFTKRTIDGAERDVKQLRKDIDQVKLEYMHKSDFAEFKIELKDMFKEFKQDIKDSINMGK